MKNNPILALVLAIALLPGTAAFADGNGHGNGNGRHDQRGGHEEHMQRDRPDRDRGHEGRPDQRDYRSRMYDNDRRGPGAGPNHDFYRGERLSSEYRSRNYVVDDWRSHRLSAPPRGYHWVQAGGDYVLVAIATGVILQILLNH